MQHRMWRFGSGPVRQGRLLHLRQLPEGHSSVDDTRFDEPRDHLGDLAVRQALFHAPLLSPVFLPRCLFVAADTIGLPKR
ncbi:hypothetical protein DMH15_04725 [Streptomyces sp. WAC 06725]|nr:hypothetical protein DMH15_04725 [Streptomyces sp. WAC 06725]